MVQNEMGGRFLQKDEQNPDYWTVASDQSARLKVAHGFRAGKSRSSLSLDDSDEAENTSDGNGASGSTRTGDLAFSDMSLIDYSAETQIGRRASKLARLSA